ncbi:MAG: hypothetical protein KGR26_03800 [Cyanobacteria bacterium REEB65]|nr:hypothetical protein [Cyanobacteria bacterium REEB65]
MRHVVLALSLLVAGCDSSSWYTADLGQDGAVPQLEAIADHQIATASVEAYKFAPAGSGSLPQDWLAAQSLKVQVMGTFVPLAASTVGASKSFEALIPATLGFTPPLSGAQTFAFEVDNDHVDMAQVTF